MNIFGSFSFGKLIKTFLPGFLIILTLIGYLDLFIVLIGNAHIFKKLFLNNCLITVSFLIPFSIIFGIFSNIIFFTYATDILIRKPHEKKDPTFYSYEKSIHNLIKNHYSKHLFISEIDINNFFNYCDVPYFILRDLPLDKLVFLQDSYWYYLEFQLNILFALVLSSPLIICQLHTVLMPIEISIMIKSVIIAFAIITLALLMYILLKTARINFDLYKKKYLSLLISNFYTLEIKEKAQ